MFERKTVWSKFQCCLLIFLLAMGVRLATLNQMGKTWDEIPYVETGYHFVELASAGNFLDPFWYLQSDHPPLARYIYGLFGIPDIKEFGGSQTVFHYNYTFPRMVSAFFASLTAVFVLLIGLKYFNSFIAISSGVIFALNPFFVGLSQTATLESLIMFFFTGAIYFLFEYLVSDKVRPAVLTGVFSGLALLVKQSNILIFPLLCCLIVLYAVYEKRKKTTLQKKFRGLILIGIVSFLTFGLFWPMPFFNIAQTWGVQQSMWIDAVKLPPPERFAGVLILVPWPYYFFMFFATTPLVLVTLSFIGALRIDKTRNFISIAILIWFLFPFIQTFYPFKQHGLRYIIQLYAPFALLCGIGLSYIGDRFVKFKYSHYIALSALLLYLSLTLIKIHPYYLDYFSENVGGINNVYNKKLFQLGWWGQGIGEAAFYINSIEDDVVTVAVEGDQSALVMPDLAHIKTTIYKKDTNADYVLVTYFSLVRLNFPEYELKGRYREIHSVMADKAKLVKIYKRISNK